MRRAGEGEDDNAGRRIRLLERHREQIDRIGLVSIETEMQNPNAVEPSAR